jgi:hypothetical protein
MTDPEFLALPSGGAQTNEDLQPANGAMPTEALMTALKSASTMAKLPYAEKLLAQALPSRDAEAALLLAQMMDADPSLDKALAVRLDEALNSEPDCVYAFIRPRVNADPDERWRERLKAAAVVSLRVAIADADAETILNWLKLIAREPASYGLSDVLRNGLLAAQERARTEPNLARGVMSIAIKRAPSIVDTLLNDPELLAALPNNIGRTLRDHTGDAVALFNTHGPEVFLVALARAARAQAPDLFTAAAADQLWTLSQAQGAHYTEKYTPQDIFTELMARGTGWLPDEALETLLSLALQDRRDDLFLGFVRGLGRDPRLLSLLTYAFDAGQRGVSDVLALVAQISVNGDLTPQNTVDLYVALLERWDWPKTALPIMSQIARLVQQHSTLNVETRVWWRLLDEAADEKDEFIAKIALRRLTPKLETLEDETDLVEALQRLCTLMGWSAVTRAQVQSWWRGFVRGQPLARLQRLDKLVDGKRGLEDLRSILLTVVAFRRMLGKRVLKQFIEDMGTTFTVLQSVAESFDPSPRRPVSFDPATVREELDSRSEELTPQEIQILANSLKELAGVVAAMGDSRTKASLMRRGDDVDRQLMTGELQPHSAVDALKWMAGYLSGAQDDDEDTGE